MTVNRLLKEMDSAEISEWMAFELSRQPEFLEKWKKEEELKRFRAMSKEHQIAMFKKVFRGSK